MKTGIELTTYASSVQFEIAPPPVTVDGLPHIQVHQLLEPARTGFQVWLTWSGKSTVEYSGAPLGVAPEALYSEFLRTAI
ncbi:MAG: hypothetical protein ABTQ26_05695 [Azonexus sp.]